VKKRRVLVVCSGKLCPEPDGGGREFGTRRVTCLTSGRLDAAVHAADAFVHLSAS
jgi:hypothetical protein